MIGILFLGGCGGPPAPPSPPEDPPSDLDGDGFDQDDCDDDDPTIFPGAADPVGDGVDGDCNGTDLATIHLQDAARLIVEGEGEQDELGISVACSEGPVGDWPSAILVGADQSWTSALDGPQAGYAVLYGGDAAGLQPAAEWRVDGTDDRDGIGVRVVFPGDVDGDGQGEVLVTAGSASRPGRHSGGAFLYRPITGARTTPEDAPTWIQGEALSVLFGAAPVGDVDGDGLAELLVSSTWFSSLEQSGVIHLFNARDLAPTLAPSDSWIDVPATEPMTGTGFSMTVGELTGDGELDLIHGEYNFNLGGDSGRVTLAPGPPEAWSLADPIVLSGVGTDSSLGLTLATGDLSGDGQTDLVVTSHVSSRFGERRGAAYVFFGPIVGDVDTAAADVTVIGETDFAWMGSGAAVLDLNGDGALDLAVAASSDVYFSPHRPGLVYVFRGPLDQGELDHAEAMVVYQGIEGSEILGSAMAGCDLDGDGDDELVIGARGNAGGVPMRGRTFVVDGSPQPGG